jgi:T-complex protein 1 subunit beta
MQLTIRIFAAAELLREAEKLIGLKLHPQTIIAGWRKATDVARKALLDSTKDNGYISSDFHCI